MSHKRQVVEEPQNDTVSDEEIENQSFVNPRTFSDADSGSDTDSPLPSPSLYTIRPISPNPEQVKPPKKAKKTKNSSLDSGGGGGGEGGGKIDDAKKKKTKKKKNSSVDDGGGEGDADGGGGGGEGGGDTENSKKKKKRKTHSSVDGGGGDGDADGHGGGGEGGGDTENTKKKKSKKKNGSIDGGGDEGYVVGDGGGGRHGRGETDHSKEKNKKPKLDAETKSVAGGGDGGVTLALFANRGREFSKQKKQKQVSKDSSVARKEVRLSAERSLAVKNEDDDEQMVDHVDFEESEEAAEMEKWWEKYPCLRQSFEIESHLNDGAKRLLREKFCSIGETKLEELEKRWRDLRSVELKLFMERSELVNEQVKLVIDAVKSEDSKDPQLQILSE